MRRWSRRPLRSEATTPDSRRLGAGRSGRRRAAAGRCISPPPIRCTISEPCSITRRRRPGPTSLYKGAVANSARSVYSGLIRVEKGAAGTNAMQTNRNLVLHEGAHADSVPNLEIEDNDVRCSHASAVGPIAEDQHFYLESRGVPPDAADRLIALGFLDEVLEQLPVPAVVDTLRRVLAAKLDAADSAESRLRVGPHDEGKIDAGARLASLPPRSSRERRAPRCGAGRRVPGPYRR